MDLIKKERKEMAKLPYIVTYKFIPRKNGVEMIRCEAIPVEWILNNEKLPKKGKGRDAIMDMIEDWRKENEQSDIKRRT